MLRRMVGEDVEVVTLTHSREDVVRMDPVQLEQVMINLVVNARDAMPNGGKIIIETGEESLPSETANVSLPPGDYVTLRVRDTGIGIPADVIERIFEPFFTTKEPGRGTGLGLSTCYGIVAQAGGQITVHSEPGNGSTFTIYLPKVSEAVRKPQAAVTTESMPTGTETILLVEDEPLVREITAHVLRERGYTVVEAENGIEALRIVRDDPDLHIDLMLTDVVMPLMGGRELSHKLREIHPRTKIIYTSGYVEQRVGSEGMLQEGATFMQKPFTPVILAARVREMLDSE
jgi:CheY-like chemotaxis protein